MIGTAIFNSPGRYFLLVCIIVFFTIDFLFLYCFLWICISINSKLYCRNNHNMTAYSIISTHALFCITPVVLYNKIKCMKNRFMHFALHTFIYKLSVQIKPICYMFSKIILVHLRMFCYVIFYLIYLLFFDSQYFSSNLGIFYI